MSFFSKTRFEPKSVFDSDFQYRTRLVQAVRNLSGDRLKAIRELVPDNVWNDDAELKNYLKQHPETQSHFSLISQYTTSKWLLEQELKARGIIPQDYADDDLYERASNKPSVGVCFSGGGIRSATFNLGVLQALAQLDLIQRIDYLSTVSGGGYIHQFLASWLSRRKCRSAVETMLKPIPSQLAVDAPDEIKTPATETLPTNSQQTNNTDKDSSKERIVEAEPIRWLRRYSNYLSPSVSVFGADVWTIFTVWVRNMVLNLVILIAVIMAILLVPHAAVTTWALSKRHLGSLCERIPIFLLVVAPAIASCVLLWRSFPKHDFERRNTPCPEDRPHAHAIVLGWLAAVMCIAPVVYKLAVPGGSQFSGPATGAYAQLHFPIQNSGQFVFRSTPGLTQGYWNLCDSEGKNCKTEAATNQPASKQEKSDTSCDDEGKSCKPKSGDLRIEWAWRNGEHRPECTVPSAMASWIPCAPAHLQYVSHGLVRKDDFRIDESPLVWAYDGFPVLCAFFFVGIWAGQKEPTSVPEAGQRKRTNHLGRILSIFIVLPAVLLAFILLTSVGFLFFATTFLVHQKLIASLGIALLPSLLLAVPFITLELCTGLMGTLLGSAQREWVARLRAVSIQYGALWFAIVGMSLLGRYISELLGHEVIVKYAAWSSWAVTTAAGVLLGKSRLTDGKPKDKSGETPAKGSLVSELIVKIAPPIFIAGLFILLSTLISWLLQGPDKGNIAEPQGLWFGLLVAMVVIGFLFSSRIDINEFSMNAFYRDRLARCYAGASNPKRRPDPFTGFDVEDGRLRLTELLPKNWIDLNGKGGTYDGPFPIFCTTLNLTTGRDLAYQERKAASFCLTPLYSGYSTGWTEGTDSKLQYNGFIPTSMHVKHPNGITMASAVAISGAAASPNMGFHSSAPMAFLMTVFNVRLGWWIRNPRRPDARDYPRNAMVQLLSELGGITNDTAEFIYLSDGGHFENMGLYELLRRRCSKIVICDAEEDGKLLFEGIGMAIRKARIDFGVEVQITRALGNISEKPSPVAGIAAGVPSADASSTEKAPGREGQQAKKTDSQEIFAEMERLIASAAPRPVDQENPTGAEGLMQFKPFPGNLFHALEGTIRYPEDQGDASGRLLYLKSTLNGNEPADILNYHRMHSAFPFDTTLDQFFTESQFESYRRLGQHIALEPSIKEWLNRNIGGVAERRDLR